MVEVKEERKNTVSALNIKDPETHRLARELSRRTGRSITEAVRESLRQSLAQQKGSDREEKRLVERVMAIARRAAARPVLDPRTPEEIIGYDNFGVPR